MGFITCKNCKKQVKVRNYLVGTRDFCSHLCRRQSHITFCDNYMVIYGIKVLYDNKYLNEIKKRAWFISDGYVRSRTSGKWISLHQLILGKKEGYDTDHINGDRLDNRKENLRHVTRSQNMMNVKRTGVSYSQHRKKWMVQIQKLDKRVQIGFNTLIEAIYSRRLLEQTLFGEYSYGK